jgi:hypothetical protein
VEAVSNWTEAAVPVLESVARRYNGTITYVDFAAAVQDATGIETRSLLQNWIGDVLGAVARRQPAGEPTLTSLVIRADGTIGPGYADPVTERDGEVPVDLDWHSAEERLACYRHFGAALPPDGGRPTLTAKVAARRQRARGGAPVRAVCRSCGLRLPASELCDNCDPQ